MKATLSFNLPEEQEAFEEASNGWKYKSQLDDMWTQLFRPFYKHGYQDQLINVLLGYESEEENLTDAQRACQSLLERLEMIYKEIIRED